MLYFKKKPDAQFYFLIFGLIATIYLALFHIKILCIQDYDLRVYTEHGEYKTEKVYTDTKQCFPIWKYFKEVRIRQEKQKQEAIELYAKSRYGEYDYNSSWSSVGDSLFNSSSS